MKHFYFFVLLIFSPIFTFSQAYDVSAGLRLGTEWGATGQFRIGEQETIEGIIQQSFGKDQTMFTTMYEHHQKFIGKRFNVYKGGGVHFGSIGENSNLKDPKNPFGITAVAGIETTLARYNISYDIKPAINLSGGYKTIDFQTGLSVRYVIDKRKVQIFGGKKRKKNSDERSKVGQVIDDIFKRDEKK